VDGGTPNSPPTLVAVDGGGPNNHPTWGFSLTDGPSKPIT
jgi:hypothetical protein